MDISLAGLKITAILVAIHWTPLLLSAWLWPLKKIDFSVTSALTVLFTVIAWLIVGTCILLFFDVNANGRQMTWFAAYAIYSVVSLGVIPLIVIAVHIFAGRSAGLWVRSLMRGLQAGPSM